MRVLNKQNRIFKVSAYLLIQLFLLTNAGFAAGQIQSPESNTDTLSPSLNLPASIVQNVFQANNEDIGRINSFFEKYNLGEFDNDKHVVFVLKCDGVEDLERAMQYIQKDFKILFMAESNFDQQLLSKVYDKEHKGRPYCQSLKNYLQYGSMTLVLEKKGTQGAPAWYQARDLVGCKWGTDPDSYRWDKQVVAFEALPGEQHIKVYKIGKGTFTGNGTAGLSIDEKKAYRDSPEEKILIGRVKLKDKISKDRGQIALTATGTHSPDNDNGNIEEGALLLESVPEAAENLVDAKGEIKVDIEGLKVKGVNPQTTAGMITFVKDILGFKTIDAQSHRVGDIGMNTIKAAYRYEGISIGGTKLAISINDGFNRIQAELKFDWLEAYGTKEHLKKADPNEMMQIVGKKVVELLNQHNVDRDNIGVVHSTLAGPVDKENGIWGTDFPAPNLSQFNKYPYSSTLKKILAQEWGMDIKAPISNDCEGAGKGEQYSPLGILRNVKDGCIVLLGTGANITNIADGTLMEGGHNLIQGFDAKGKVTWKWVGDITGGKHPIEIGNTPKEIIRKCGDMGRAYLADSEQFFKDNPGYPVIEYGKGLRDFEDYFAGPGLEGRLKKDGLEKYTPITVTEAAKEGKQDARDWIKNNGYELGQALAALIAKYPERDFVKRMALISSVNEGLGKNVYDLEQEKDDIYISSIHEGAEADLVNKYGMQPQGAGALARGIERSRMTYERELISYNPTNEEMIATYLKMQEKELVLIKAEIQEISQQIEREVDQKFDKRDDSLELAINKVTFLIGRIESHNIFLPASVGVEILLLADKVLNHIKTNHKQEEMKRVTIAVNRMSKTFEYHTKNKIARKIKFASLKEQKRKISKKEFVDAVKEVKEDVSKVDNALSVFAEYSENIYTYQEYCNAWERVFNLRNSLINSKGSGFSQQQWLSIYEAINAILSRLELDSRQSRLASFDLSNHIRNMVLKNKQENQAIYKMASAMLETIQKIIQKAKTGKELANITKEDMTIDIMNVSLKVDGAMAMALQNLLVVQEVMEERVAGNQLSLVESAI
ncbi:MAG: hypothetical protein GY853_06180 [PVC group bacterium]|nr:hypothetical protein [PVC group bacterium]